MLEDHLKSPVTRRRLRASLVAPHVDAFADWLHERGYAPITVDLRLRSLASWAGWLEAKGQVLTDAVASLKVLREELANGRLHYSRGPNDDSRVAAEVLVAFLRERGVIPAAPAPLSAHDRHPILADFHLWMRTNRGLRESTLDLYEDVIDDLLAKLGDDPATLKAENLRAFVLERALPHGVDRAKAITTGIRAYLRFLAATGQCAVTLADAIPNYAGWTLSSTPRYLEPGDVEKVLAACVADDAWGLRDRAVMLLLARLGLRASDVAGLTLGDIDWKNARIAVCGKGRRQEWLPLPQDIGDALLRYLGEARPRTAGDRVFAKVNAPFGMLTRAAVTGIARSALRRAGIKAPINGAHVFRHSAATAMLRQGVSLAGVGAVLRHKSPSTTAHYAKVDFGLLSEVAQPWPEVAPC